MTAQEENRRALPWRRLAAEFVVIVVGVLVALAADAAREARDDRAREAAYIGQLREDLSRTRQDLEAAIAIDEAAMASADRALRALSAGNVPAADSLRIWTSEATNSSARFHPTMGTVTALVESGQLRLVQSESVRQRVLQYHSAVAGAVRIIDGLNPPMWRALDRLGEAVRLSGLVESDERSPFQNDWAALASNRTFHDGLYSLRLIAQNRLFALRPLLRSLEALQAELDTVGSPGQ